MIYGKILKELRENAGLKQKDLAKIINVNENLYCMYEKEYQIIPIKYLVIFADEFQISVDYLFSLSKSKKYYKTKNKYNQNNFAKRIKELRKNNKLTQEKLAQVLNTTHSVISDYEHGKKIINTIFLYALCTKYKISADYLLGRVDEPIYITKK